MKNLFEIQNSQVLLFVKDQSRWEQVLLDEADLPRVQAFPGTWSFVQVKGQLYAQGKQGKRTVYLHRWLTEAADEERVQFRASTLDCRRSNLEITLRRRSYRRQIARRPTPFERQQYTKVLAQRLSEQSAVPVLPILRGLHRDALSPELEEAASRLASKRLGSLPRLRVRAGWEYRLPVVLDHLERSTAKLVFRRDVETLFQVSRQTALRILDRFGASFYGTALALPRLTLLERLHEVEADPAISWERERHRSVFQAVTRDELGEALGVAAQRLAGNRAYVEGDAARAHCQSQFASLPDRIQLTKTELRLQFAGFTEFLEQIGLIVYALHNDAPALETFLTESDTGRIHS